MPISVKLELQALSQLEFSKLTYEIMAVAFSLQNKLGGLFDEEMYKTLLAKKLKHAESEVGIDGRCPDNKTIC